jgi:hypothetical protein
VRGFLSVFILHGLTLALNPSHNPALVLVTCVSLSASDGSAVRSSFERFCHQFEDVVGLTDADVAAKINAAGTMLLIDLNGFTHGARSAVTAMRPAPLTVFDQVSVSQSALMVVTLLTLFALGLRGNIRGVGDACKQRPR